MIAGTSLGSSHRLHLSHFFSGLVPVVPVDVIHTHEKRLSAIVCHRGQGMSARVFIWYLEPCLRSIAIPEAPQLSLGGTAQSERAEARV